MQKIKILLLLSIATVLLALNGNDESSPREEIKLAFFTDLGQLKSDLITLQQAGSRNDSKENLLQKFTQARLTFKRAEAFLAYYDDTWFAQLNGPNLQKVDEASTQYQVVNPHGFQVIEQLLIEDFTTTTTEEIASECAFMISTLERIQKEQQRFTFYDREIMESLQQEVIRINALGLTGFDSPLLHLSIIETQSALTSLGINLEMMKGLLKTSDQTPFLITCIESTEKAIKQLDGQNFNDLDRLTYIKNFLNPLFRELVTLQQELGVETYSQTFGSPGALNEKVDNLYAQDLVNRFFFLRAATHQPILS